MYTGGSRHYNPADLGPVVKKFLNSRGITLPTDSGSFKILVDLFRRAYRENNKRDQARIRKGDLIPTELIFKDLFAHSAVELPVPAVTLSQLLARYRQWLADKNAVEGTIRTYETPMRLLSQLVGDSTVLSTLQPGWAEQLMKKLTQVPRNAEQRYRGIPYEKAIALENKLSHPQRLGAKTLENYLTNISAISISLWRGSCSRKIHSGKRALGRLFLKMMKRKKRCFLTW